MTTGTFRGLAVAALPVMLVAVGATKRLPRAPEPPAFVAHVADVVDGDSFVLRVGNRRLGARLFDVDCPEMDTREGERAKQVTTALVGGRRVWIFPSGARKRDKHDRILVRIWTRGGWLSDALLRKGTARRYPDPDHPSAGRTEAPARRETDPEKDGPTVYITKAGERYHRADCRHVAGGAMAVSLGEAKAQGYTPCKVCRPPE